VLANNCAAFFHAGAIGYKVKTTSAIGQMMVNDATTLGNYNNGLLTLMTDNRRLTDHR
jgi:hypothetical protein